MERSRFNTPLVAFGHNLLHSFFQLISSSDSIGQDKNTKQLFGRLFQEMYHPLNQHLCLARSRGSSYQMSTLAQLDSLSLPFG